jgi:hypothetical protein
MAQKLHYYGNETVEEGAESRSYEQILERGIYLYKMAWTHQKNL